MNGTCPRPSPEDLVVLSKGDAGESGGIADSGSRAAGPAACASCGRIAQDHGEEAPEPGGRWTARLLAVVLLGVEAVIMVESWHGLTGFAGLIGVHGPDAWGVPITLDGVSLVAALVALRAELMAEASGLYQSVLFAFTAASAAANYWHGRVTGSEAKALYFGGMSVAAALVFALALRQIRHEDRRRAGRVTTRLPKFSLAHWVRFPLLTWTAWSLSVRDGHTSPRQALDAALHLRAVSSPDAFPAADAASAVVHREARRQPPEAAAKRGTREDVQRPDVGAGASGRRRRRSDRDEEALRVLSSRPDVVTGADLGRALGMSKRSGQRILARMGNAPASLPVDGLH